MVPLPLEQMIWPYQPWVSMQRLYPLPLRSRMKAAMALASGEDRGAEPLKLRLSV